MFHEQLSDFATRVCGFANGFQASPFEHVVIITRGKDTHADLSDRNVRVFSARRPSATHKMRPLRPLLGFDETIGNAQSNYVCDGLQSTFYKIHRIARTSNTKRKSCKTVELYLFARIYFVRYGERE